MINKVLNAPINLFFDVTPIGRILNRFSKDLFVIDCHLSFCFGWFTVLFYYTMSVFVIAIIAVKWIIFGMPFVFYAL